LGSGNPALTHWKDRRRRRDIDDERANALQFVDKSLDLRAK